MSEEHKDLLKWWAARFPRERLGDESGPTWKGQQALKELKDFSIAAIQEAMNDELKRDRAKSIDHVISLLRNNQGQRDSGDTPEWLFGCFGGEVARRGSHLGLVVKEGGCDLKDEQCAQQPEHQVWTPITTRVYKKKYWSRVLPDSLQHGWTILNPIKGGEIRGQWADDVKAGKFDGGCFSRAMGNALRLDEEFVETRQEALARPKKAQAKVTVGLSSISDIVDEIAPIASETIKEDWVAPVLTKEEEDRGLLF